MKALAFINPRLTTRNVGDVFIEDSARRILVHDPERSFDVDPRQPVPAAAIERINRTDAAVIVGTNLWHRRLPRPRCWSLGLEDLKRIRVPIIPLGVGTSRRFDEDDGFEPETIAQLRWIHASCALGSARDPRTARALEAAGIRNVAMTGCPTLFRSLSPEWRLRRKDSREVALTLRDGQRRNARVLVRSLRRLGLEPVIAAQKPRDALSRFRIPFAGPPVPRVHEWRIEPYLDLVERTVGAIGWRLHGNMFHLAAGNPAVFFANNSRAASFCEAFGLPCISCADRERIPPDRIVEHAARLLDPATFVAFPERYARVRAEMVRFLEANGLEHRLG